MPTQREKAENLVDYRQDSERLLAVLLKATSLMTVKQLAKLDAWVQARNVAEWSRIDAEIQDKMDGR